MDKKPKFSRRDLQIVELPQRETMLKIGPLKLHLNNIRLFNNL